MSKYRSIDVGNTLFGKVKLDPVCIACDRPFGPASQVRYLYHPCHCRGGGRGRYGSEALLIKLGCGEHIDMYVCTVPKLDYDNDSIVEVLSDIFNGI